jgi:hypothetical protein
MLMPLLLLLQRPLIFSLYFYSTIGLGAWSKGGKSTDALSLSTKVGPISAIDADAIVAATAATISGC